MKGHLLRILGLGFGLAVGVGAAIGGEILRLSGGVAKVLPDPRMQLASLALSLSLFVGAFLAQPRLEGGALGMLVLAWPLWRWRRSR